MRYVTRNRILLAVFSLGLTIGGGNAFPQQDKIKLENITIGSPGGRNSLAGIVHEIGLDQKFYEKEGLKVDILMMKSQALNAALVTGGIDYGSGVGNTIRAGVAGGPTKVLFVVAIARPTYIDARTDIKKVIDLKGKTIGINNIGDSEHWATKKALAYHGLNPDKDVTFVPVGPTLKLSALLAGSIDAVYTSQEDTFILKKRGFNAVVRVSDIAPSLAQGIGSNDRKLKENPQQVKKVLKGTLKSLMFTKEHKNTVVDFMVRNFGYDKIQMSEGYDEYLPYFTKDGTVSDKLVEDTIQQTKDLGFSVKPGITPKDLVNFGPLREVHKELGLSHQ